METPTAFLKESTRTVHESTESGFDLGVALSSPVRYARLLTVLHATVGPLEAAIDDVLGPAVRGVHPRGEMSEWLKADLDALSVSPPSRPVDSAECGFVDSKPAALGALYVLEGSMLGGQLIARRLQESLGVGPDNGGRYYAGRGPQTFAHWKNVKSFLDAGLARPDEPGAALNAALQTFALFGRAFRSLDHD